MRLFLFALLLLPGTLHAQADTALTRQVDSLFARWNRNTPGCAVGVARSGQTLLTRGYGMANLEYGVPLGADAVLETGSVAKQFTSAALALLQLEGKLSLDDDVRRYLPEVPDFGKTIAIRHLLTHTSGLRDQWGLLGLMGNPPTTQVHTLPLILHLVSRQRDLNFPTGSAYLYSNTGYALAGLIVQRVTGQSLATFSQERFFQPMGMTKTQWRDDYKRVVPGRATAYERRPDGSYAQLMPFTNVYGNGGLLTTVGDMLIWNVALSNGSIPGGKPLVALLETRQRLTGGQTIAYALGLVHSAWQGHRQIQHGGSTAGYQTYLTRFPDDDVSIAVFCNGTDGNPTGSALQIAGLLLPRQGAAVATNRASVDTTMNRALAGRYRDAATDNVLDVLGDATGLSVRMGGGGAPVMPLGGMRYRAENGMVLEFSGTRPGRQVRVTDGDDVTSTFSEVITPDASKLRLADYGGEYESPELGVRYLLKVDNGQLVVRFPPAPDERLTPLYPDGFMAGGRTVRFVRNAGGRVTELRVFAGRVRGVRFVRVGEG
ncbi:MAG: serine hydrolase domain-containing protein [Gemmatimonadaceae bacterium]